MKMKGKQSMTTIKIAGVLLFLALLVFMVLGIRPINTCSVCGHKYFGKQEAIHDKPACDTCHEIWWVNNYSKCVETKMGEEKR